ncbi:hypothetical protein KC367_g2805 [Hortaea werneckii]|uniref:Transcription factor domain-containing protein n=2 Tax=Hortaea werneckii TaxID=91943 RepID=A0A3M7JFF5_HORWE|nr:hypothetical protein KC358_g3350 [Hortaea werneckii]OTA24634.1 hypothetical protein BTJ68_11858 [Hortaea werneckii EXF-2000]KAI6850189.1 hypothetical protein KC350_g2241 [Hortaea werneckii]KAI6940990.1 hypothetical protein KC341_g3173 [Hortaea werneckii]KAI6948090.1 hypothetical protein KC348_g2130 [Hortaea werneckii]
MFTPVYRPSDGQQGFLARHRKREQKRKRDENDHDSSADDDDDDNDDDEAANPDHPSNYGRSGRVSSFLPVNRTEPYHVAGHSRQAPLPSFPFPHAPPIDRARYHERGDEKELTTLNPPLFLPKDPINDGINSSKRRHADNITTILHRCMLQGDWQRAARAWGLLLRTEIAGRGTDVRQNGRWGIGAELLLRRDQQLPPTHRTTRFPGSRDVGENTDDAGTHAEPSAVPDEPVFSDQGFRLAKDYYERLVLQYPHLPRSGHSSVNAVVFYPALFNIWIFEVQDRSKRARQSLETRRENSLPASEPSDLSHDNERQTAIRHQELQEGLPIAQRMDDLMLSPPYDASLPLLQLRGMVGLWLADLHRMIADAASSEDGMDGNVNVQQFRDQEAREKERAVHFLRKAKNAGAELSKATLDAIESS